jgi:nucleotide-binding universal stress UspA family protein/GNAT superfamily N-acetyltransferase
VRRGGGAVKNEPVVLRGGERVLIRAVRPEDKALLADGFARLSPESRYRRFLAHRGGLSEAQLVYLTEVDHCDHEALGALEAERGEGLGVARYIRLAEDRECAEVAVAVADDWQGRGLGRALLERLSDRARAEGIRRFSAVVQADNQRSLALVERLGHCRRSSAGPEVELEVELPSEGLGWELAAALRAAAASLFAFPGLGERLLARAREVYEGRTALQPASWSPGAPVVVGTDGSQAAMAAVRAAGELACALGAPLHLVSAYRSLSWRHLHVDPGETPHGLGWAGRREADARVVLERAKAALGERAEVGQHVGHGEPSQVLLEVARELGAQLLVVGDSGPSGLTPVALGSVPHAVVHHAPCHVLIVRAPS